MKQLTGKQDSITLYGQPSAQPIVYEAEIVNLHPEAVTEMDFFRCLTGNGLKMC
jgi:hypothetical protein